MSQPNCLFTFQFAIVMALAAVGLVDSLPPVVQQYKEEPPKPYKFEYGVADDYHGTRWEPEADSLDALNYP